MVTNPDRTWADYGRPHRPTCPSCKVPVDVDEPWVTGPHPVEPGNDWVYHEGHLPGEYVNPKVSR